PVAWARDDEARNRLPPPTGAAGVAAEPDAVDQLITLCARLPLALAIAAALATTEPHRSLHDLVGPLGDTRGTLDALGGNDAASNLRAVFACSYQALRPAAARLYRLLGLHTGPDIGAAAAASLAGLPPDQVNPLLDELTAANLITEHVPGRYTFHDLLRAYAREQALSRDSDVRRHEAVHRLLDHYLHTATVADHLL